MNKIRDWMHGKGRNVVIVFLILGSVLIIADFVGREHSERITGREKSTTVPAVLEQRDAFATSIPEETSKDRQTTSAPEETPIDGGQRGK